MRILGKTEQVVFAVLIVGLLLSLSGNAMLCLKWKHTLTMLEVAEAMLADQQESEVMPAAEILVHVVGEVNQPGIYSLVEGSRIFEAIEAAGGLTAAADTRQINLAAVAVDGQQIIVPKEGEQPTVFPEPHSSNPAAGLINVNTASAELLETLPGIGPAKASAIVQYRQQHGSFQRPEDLLNVKGIGPATFEGMKDLITVR